MIIKSKMIENDQLWPDSQRKRGNLYFSVIVPIRLQLGKKEKCLRIPHDLSSTAMSLEK